MILEQCIRNDVKSNNDNETQELYLFSKMAHCRFQHVTEQAQLRFKSIWKCVWLNSSLKKSWICLFIWFLKPVEVIVSDSTFSHYAKLITC